MMPDIFLAGVTGGDSTAMDEAWYFVWANYSKERKPIPEHKLVHFVRERVPSHSVIRTIEIMERDGSLKSYYDVKTGTKFFEPGGRKPGV